jgi:NitT/TauT family transport system substrate-binding protein
MNTKAKSIAGIVLMTMLLLVFGTTACKRRASDTEFKKFQGPSGTSPDSLFHLRIRPKWHPHAQFAGFYMAKKMGFYENYGLDVEIQETLSDTETLESLLAKQGDVIHIDLLAALHLNRDSTVVVNIGQVSQKSAVRLVGRKSRGINSLADFQGKKLGMWRVGSNLITQAFLAEHGITMEIIPIDWSINLFTQNAVDVINVMQYNEYHQLLQAGIPEEDLFVVSMDTPGFDIPDEGFYVTPEFYAAHPDICKAFTEATMDGWTFAFTHQKETIDEVIVYMQKAKIRANLAHQRWMLSQMQDIVMAKPDQLGILNKTDYLNALNIMHKMSMSTRRIPYEEFYPLVTQ